MNDSVNNLPPVCAHSADQKHQVGRARLLRDMGVSCPEMRRMGLPEVAIQIAHGRDPENIDPYGPNNPPMTRPGEVNHEC